jgi:hypothetical protein
MAARNGSADHGGGARRVPPSLAVIVAGLTVTA